MLQPLGEALMVFLAAAVIALVAAWLGSATDSAKVTVPERVPFAGGHEPEVHAWNRYHARYYTMAILFVAFDMEMVFMYPWAVVYVREGLTALVEMLMFIAILVIGVVYAWREGALEWQ